VNFTANSMNFQLFATAYDTSNNESGFSSVVPKLIGGDNDLKVATGAYEAKETCYGNVETT